MAVSNRSELSAKMPLVIMGLCVLNVCFWGKSRFAWKQNCTFSSTFSHPRCPHFFVLNTDHICISPCWSRLHKARLPEHISLLLFEYLWTGLHLHLHQCRWNHLLCPCPAHSSRLGEPAQQVAVTRAHPRSLPLTCPLHRLLVVCDGTDNHCSRRTSNWCWFTSTVCSNCSNWLGMDEHSGDSTDLRCCLHRFVSFYVWPFVWMKEWFKKVVMSSTHVGCTTIRVWAWPIIISMRWNATFLLSCFSYFPFDWRKRWMNEWTSNCPFLSYLLLNCP